MRLWNTEVSRMLETMKKPQSLRQWLQVYGLYRRAFPACERKPFAMILRMYRKGKTDLWYCSREGQFLGIAITINGPDLILLDYFAVAEGHRGEGVGTALLGLLQTRYQDKGFFLEIESTLEPSENQAERIRRKQFYLQSGLEELHVLVNLFGVNMELLGRSCTLDFPSYQAFYRDNYNQWAADHIREPAAE